MPSMRRLLAFLMLVVLSQCVTGSAAKAPGPEAGAHAYTWGQEFDYLTWMADAALLKLGQAAIGAERYLDEAEQSQVVRDLMALVREIQIGEGQLSALHADPNQPAVEAQIAELGDQLDVLYRQRSDLAPLAESILQTQVSTMFSEHGFTLGGQPLPPLLFHSTPLPWALITSRRDAIAQVNNVYLRTELTLEDHISIEDEVANNLDLSTLVVPVGGVGVYPTMVAQTSDLTWLTEVISHEWAHNYLTTRPLGLFYYESQDLTTMNETAANIVGKEIGAAVIARYYPELVPPPPVTSATAPASPAPGEKPTTVVPIFDYRAEMHTTRVEVDALLAEGKVEEAEEYMEARRLIFWEHGHAIRKLNQAFFAFYGSYADSPIGPAGEDPVGAAVRELRARSGTLIQFVNRIEWLTSFEGLEKLLAETE